MLQLYLLEKILKYCFIHINIYGLIVLLYYNNNINPKFYIWSVISICATILLCGLHILFDWYKLTFFIKTKLVHIFIFDIQLFVSGFVLLIKNNNYNHYNNIYIIIQLIFIFFNSLINIHNRNQIILDFIILYK